MTNYLFEQLISYDAWLLILESHNAKFSSIL
jgi:hypothetical protein